MPHNDSVLSNRQFTIKGVATTLDLFPPAAIDAWYGLYTTGERRFYDALVGGGE